MVNLARTTSMGCVSMVANIPALAPAPIRHSGFQGLLVQSSGKCCKLSNTKFLDRYAFKSLNIGLYITWPGAMPKKLLMIKISLAAVLLKHVPPLSHDEKI